MFIERLLKLADTLDSKGFCQEADIATRIALESPKPVIFHKVLRDKTCTKCKKTKQTDSEDPVFVCDVCRDKEKERLRVLKQFKIPNTYVEKKLDPKEILRCRTKTCPNITIRGPIDKPTGAWVCFKCKQKEFQLAEESKKFISLGEGVKEIEASSGRLFVLNNGKTVLYLPVHVQSKIGMAQSHQSIKAIVDPIEKKGFGSALFQNEKGEWWVVQRTSEVDKVKTNVPPAYRNVKNYIILTSFLDGKGRVPWKDDNGKWKRQTSPCYDIKGDRVYGPDNPEEFREYQNFCMSKSHAISEASRKKLIELIIFADNLDKKGLYKEADEIDNTIGIVLGIK